MWLKALVMLVLAGLVAIPALSLAGGSSGPSGSALTVTPSTGGPSTRFDFTFRAPDASGRRGSTQLGYALSVTGPTRPGCLGLRSARVPTVAKGADASVTLDPARLGGSWCPGTFTARVSEYVTPVCGPGVMCPQFIRVIGTVARATFRVSAP